MKTNFGFWRRLGLIFLVVVLLAAIYVLITVTSVSGAREAAEETRAALRQQGFKTDLAEFDFTVPSDQRGFELSLNGSTFRPGIAPFEPATLPVPVGSNSALVVWHEDFIKCGGEDIRWADFAASVSAQEPLFLAARDEALAHPIKFSLEANRGSAMLLPHLSQLRHVSLAFSCGVIADLHEQDTAEAWTNLLATTRLVTAWEPEPSQISHLVRFALATMAYEATWQALQTNAWSDAQLAGLAREWNGVDFFKNLPESIAFQRASVVDMCRREREEPFSATLTDLLKDMMRSPGSAPQMLKAYWSQLRYHSEGTYVDEKDLLLFYRDREVDVRQRLQAPTWEAMRSMPAVTNQAVFKSKYPSRMQAFMNLRAMPMAMSRSGGGLLGGAAESEGRRRLILTAVALERFHLRHGKYPASLQELVPDFLKTPATDFMDGKPLRYQLGEDGRFLLYSIGLDCVDHGGIIPPRAFANVASRGMGLIGGPGPSGDIVWPRPASAGEVTAFHEQELKARRQQTDRATEMESEHYWDRTARRQGSVEKTLAASTTMARDLDFNGRPLSEILRNKNASGTNALTLTEMLSLRQVITGAEPETVTFEAPISYDALTNVGSLALYIDSLEDDGSEEGCGVGQMECSRATNGDCLLAWNTIFETPGKHALLMGVELNDPNAREVIVGPASAVVVSNLCQFSISSATFDNATGASLRARLPEMRCDYSIDILNTKGERVKTISGSTSDGYINAFWDLMDQRGRKLADESFNTVFHLKLPESGRTQTLRGP